MARNRLKSGLAAARISGFRFFGTALFHAATSPRLWEPILVRKLRGAQLRRLIRGAARYRSEALVSVVLPVNNGRSKGVERLVDSLKRQTHDRLEFIAVDSGSTDDTVPWLRRQGFKVIEIDPASFTHAFSRNTGAEAANGDYLLFVVDDVVFDNRDWIRCALFMLERFGADAFSSRQAIDEGADAYARVLDFFLSNAQSDRPSVNVSRNNWLVRQVRALLPLRAQFRSVSIDDTNHLVRKDVFDRVRFRAPTVEDIDFALRLTRLGGRIVYTNLLSVIHYHHYPRERLAQYARRVFLDMQVMGRWQPYGFAVGSREAFLVGALHALGNMLLALERIARPSQGRRAGKRTPRRRIDDIEDLLAASARIDSTGILSLRYERTPPFQEAYMIFREVVGGEPPPPVYYDKMVYGYAVRRFREDIRQAWKGLPRVADGGASYDDLKTVCLYLWANMVMAHLARPHIFTSREMQYPFDAWSMADWT